MKRALGVIKFTRLDWVAQISLLTRQYLNMSIKIISQDKVARILPLLKSHWASILIGLMICVFLYLRLFTYGDLRLSIGTGDTSSYLAATEQKILATDVFTRQRLLTTIIIYRLTRPDDGYHPSIVNSPAASEQNPYRQIQPDFEQTVLLQILISIFCWGKPSEDKDATTKPWNITARPFA